MFMKYLLCGYGSKSDIGTTEKYCELGFELMVSRLTYIRGLQTGLYTPDDVVVTVDDRKFLYTKLTKNVISCAEFNEIRSNNPNIEVVEWDMNLELDKLHGDYQRGLFNHYKYLEDRDLILSLDYSDVRSKYNISNEPFAGVLIRVRNWAAFRSLDDGFYSAILDELQGKYGRVFVFGLCSEKFWKGRNVTYIDNLQDWASLVHHPRCEVVVAPASGGSAVCQICGDSNLLLVTSDCEMCQRHPLYFAPSVTFGDLRIQITPTIENVREKLGGIIGGRVI
jgi:hypothetical protein